VPARLWRLGTSLDQINDIRYRHRACGQASRLGWRHVVAAEIALLPTPSTVCTVPLAA
jgi:hypothetical protein